MNLLEFPAEIITKISDYAGPLACTMIYITCSDLKKHVRGKIANNYELHTLAAASGRVKLFQWIASVVPNYLLMKAVVITTAAKNKRLDFLKWARFNGYTIHGDVCTQAALNNDYRMLKWYLSKYNDYIPKGAIQAALFNNNFQLVKWLVQKGSPLRLSWVARYGRLNVLKWLYNNPDAHGDCVVRDHFDEIINSSFNHELRHAHFHILEWCLSKGHVLDSFDTFLLEYAIMENNIRAVKAICDNVIQESLYLSPHFFHHTIFRLETCVRAAQMGRLRILEYMYNIGFVWDTATIRRAANKHVHVVKWLDTL